MPHYSDDTPLKPFPITALYRGERLALESSEGMFSKEGLDRGTEVLLDSMQLPASGRVLDLGCGIGIVGIIVKRLHPALDVVQSDVTTKAIALTLQNARALGLTTLVIKSDCYDAPQLAQLSFDVILVNPPRAAGKAVIEKMIAGAYDRLVVGGSLQLVALTNKGGASYERMMQERFGNCEKIGRGGGFSVYKSAR